MAAKSRKSFFSSLKTVIQRNQITIINASVTVILIGIVIFVMLSRASTLQRQTAEESMVNLAGQTANEVQGIYQTYYDILRTTSQIMRNYNNIEIAERRNFINNIMNEILVSNRTLISVYSLWKPNELDGMDAFYANTEGTDETGQFIGGYTKEPGWVGTRSYAEYRDILDLNFYEMGLMNGIVGETRVMDGRYRNSYVIDLQMPIVLNEEIKGIIGLSIDLEVMQFLVESRRLYGTGRTMVCSSSGFIVAHANAMLRGVSFANPGKGADEFEPLLSSGDIMFTNIQNSVYTIQPVTLRIQNTMVVIYPLRQIDPITSAYRYNDSGFPRWAVVTAVPLDTILAPINALLRFSILFTIGAAILMAFVVFFTSSGLTQRARVLQRDLERATAVQDNLKYGLFLIDSKYVIQGAYSKALERILSVPELQGKVFPDLLANSLKPKEKEGLTDYLDMVFKRSFDQDMLDSINPINLFTYVSVSTNEEKSLRTNFTLTERGMGGDYVLVTLEDITTEKELEKQLINAQNLREKEMQSIFQVIQLNPRVLSDFIEDTEYEFEKINDMLKNKTHFHREVLIEMYQSIHAVKSNALILNLETFSNRLHKLESTLKQLQEKYEDFVPFDDFLGLVLQLDEAMKEKDQLKTAISKIQNFKNLSGEDKNQEQYVLVETLTQVCNKTQAALNKKVKLVIEGIDEPVLSHGPRRVIKEVLTQLVRNAVYHGIETPEERASLSKKSEGEIRISLRYKDNQIVMKETDDGKGIDFSKIRHTAEAFNLFSNPDEVNDRNYLLNLLFSPGFSTNETADLHAGRGMGLNLVKDRIKELHGNLKVSTALGRGTTFTITIPMESQAVMSDSAG